MIKVFEPSLTLSDKLSVIRTLFNNNISGTSPIIEEFETETANIFNRKHGIAISNGSTALEIAFQLLDLKRGDEVILPSFTIISCLSAVLRTGATPIFSDVDSNTWNMDITHIEKLLTPNTKAVLMVHTYGLAADATKIKDFCETNNLFLVEDAAEAHGQIEGGKKCGSFGDISTLSFYANKHVTTGEGGMILVDSDQYSAKSRQMINLDFNNNERFKHNNLYWNYRLSGLQASLGLSQIKHLDKTISNKISQGLYYTSLLSEYADLIQCPLSEFNNVKNHYWVYGIVLKNGANREKVTDELSLRCIQTRPFFWPLHLQNSLPVEFKVSENKLPNAEFIGKNGFYIPIGNHVSKKDQDYIIENVLESINAR